MERGERQASSLTAQFLDSRRISRFFTRENYDSTFHRYSFSFPPSFLPFVRSPSPSSYRSSMYDHLHYAKLALCKHGHTYALSARVGLSHVPRFLLFRICQGINTRSEAFVDHSFPYFLFLYSSIFFPFFLVRDEGFVEAFECNDRRCAEIVEKEIHEFMTRTCCRAS